jgi:hypothetical protein
VVAALCQGAATAVCQATPSNSNHNGGIGIKLLDAPVSRRDDPRAHTYIIDYLAPGTTISRHVEVSNTASTAQSIQLYAGSASIRNATFAFGDGRSPNELTSWMSFGRTDLALPAKATAQVLVTIQVPKQASAGERYGVIWAQAAAMPSGSGGIGIVNRVGVRVYLDVGLGGEPASDFQIENLTPGRTPDGRPEVFGRVRNTGARAVDISGALTLSDGPGSLSAGPFDVATGTTLAPGNVAPVTVVLDKRLPNGPWHAELTLTSGLITKTADAMLTFPSAGVGAPVVAQAASMGPSALPGPLLLVLLGLACAALFAIGIRFGRRRRRAG